MSRAGGGQVGDLLPLLDAGKTLSLGLVDGRNIWRNDYQKSLETLRRAVESLSEERVWIAPSCSLLHVPYSLRFEQKLIPKSNRGSPSPKKNWRSLPKFAWPTKARRTSSRETRRP